MKKALASVLAIMQLVFFLSCTRVSFINTDTESSYYGSSMFGKMSNYIENIRQQGTVFLAGLMFIGIIIAPIVIILMLQFFNNNKKYIYSLIFLFISILSIVHFCMEEMPFMYVLRISYSFYIMIGTSIVSIVLCLIGIFSRTKNECIG